MEILEIDQANRGPGATGILKRCQALVKLAEDESESAQPVKCLTHTENRRKVADSGVIVRPAGLVCSDYRLNKAYYAFYSSAGAGTSAGARPAVPPGLAFFAGMHNISPRLSHGRGVAGTKAGKLYRSEFKLA
ncbi:hypothetical protein EVAR_74144_1 [Eumeta japonica]|uniref:Uncharacterized protein n=1 Tax=Eumeta variegata TaxID=151549 RepID=A0A4C1SBG3_EUMVA|nr:hypothetical protein EVAR_74144_1 [Eumeta japonica]